MDRLRENLGRWDFRRVNREVSQLGDTRGVDEDWVLALLELVPILRREYPEIWRTEISQEEFEQPQFVGIVWRVGEVIRQVLKRRRSLRKKPAIWQGVEDVCRNRPLGRGRESFVILLGQYGGQAQVPLLIELLEDEEVAGHALYALRLLGAPEALALVPRFLSSERPWIRNEAKRYLAKVGTTLDPAAEPGGSPAC